MTNLQQVDLHAVELYWKSRGGVAESTRTSRGRRRMRSGCSGSLRNPHARPAWASRRSLVTSDRKAECRRGPATSTAGAAGCNVCAPSPERP